MTAALRPELPALMIEDQVRAALTEDLGRAGDITTLSTIGPELTATAGMNARDPGVVAGLDLVGLKEHPVDRQPVSRSPRDDLRQDEVPANDATGRREGQLAALAVEGDFPEIGWGNR